MNEKTVWQGKTVLVVEDSVLVQKAVGAAYTELGMQVVGYANNGLEALDRYHELNPDLISLDIIMPQMHGIDCYRKLHSENPDLKAVFISSLAADAKICQSFPDLILPALFIEKPVRVDALRAAMQLVFANPASLPTEGV